MQWDIGLKYEEVKQKIVQELKKLELNKIRQIRRVTHLCIAAIQLRNTLRASEAVEAFYQFMHGKLQEC